MIGFTYAQLLQAMQDWPVNLGANYISNIPRFVELGELRLVRDLNLEIFDVVNSAFVLAAGANVIEKPAELVSLRTLRLAAFTPDTTTALLLHMDGANGSSAFVDSSPNAFPVTVLGSASLESANPRFGSAAGSFPYVADTSVPPLNALSVPIAQGGPLDILSGTQDFTIECWFYVPPGTTGQCFVCDYGCTSFADTGIHGITLSINATDGAIEANGHWNGPGGPGGGIGGFGLTITTGIWHHVAVVRLASTASLYFDGVVCEWVATWTGYVSQGLPLTIGGSINTPTNNSTAGLLLDEFRVSNVARYTANFTPPTAPFALSAATLGKSFPLYKRSWDFVQNMASDPTVTAPPRYYAETDLNTWAVAQAADQAYTAIVRYLSRPVSVVVAGTSWLADRCGDVLFLAALMEAEMYIKADDRFADLQGDYQSKLQVARVELRNSIREGDYSPVKPAAAPAQG